MFYLPESQTLQKRKTRAGICNVNQWDYYFETDEQTDFLRKGVSKEHRPNPIVQMGLFMDNQGIPITVSYTHLFHISIWNKLPDLLS